MNSVDQKSLVLSFDQVSTFYGHNQLIFWSSVIRSLRSKQVPFDLGRKYSLTMIFMNHVLKLKFSILPSLNLKKIGISGDPFIKIC